MIYGKLATHKHKSNDNFLYSSKNQLRYIQNCELFRKLRFLKGKYMIFKTLFCTSETNTGKY